METLLFVVTSADSRQDTPPREQCDGLRVAVGSLAHPGGGMGEVELGHRPGVVGGDTYRGASNDLGDDSEPGVDLRRHLMRAAIGPGASVGEGAQSFVWVAEKPAVKVLLSIP